MLVFDSFHLRHDYRNGLIALRSPSAKAAVDDRHTANTKADHSARIGHCSRRGFDSLPAHHRQRNGELETCEA